jgi:hypothetical protein
MALHPMRYLRSLYDRSVLRLHSVHARYFRVSAERSSSPRYFSEAEFEKDPSYVMRRAAIDGSAFVTDASGKPRMRIGAPLRRSID